MYILNDQVHRRFKEEVYTELARLGQALANPKRLEMLDLLAQRERHVEDLAQEMGLSLANASQHLRILLAARLVAVRRRGSYAYYRLAHPGVYRLWQALRQVAEAQLPEVQAVIERYLGERHELKGVDLEKLLARVQAGEVVLLDARPREEYQAGHLPGAQPAPLEELERLLPTLSPEREVVVYCRGPYCVFADEAVALLRQAGFRASRLSLSVPDLWAMGLPVERGGEG